MDRTPIHYNIRRIIFGIILFTAVASIAAWSGLKSMENSRLRLRNMERLKGLQSRINRVISKLDRAATSLAAMPIINKTAVTRLRPDSPPQKNALTAARIALSVSFIYLLDNNGTVRVCTRGLNGTTFTGHNFHFRPYFREAILGSPTRYAATGLVTGKRGIYYSAPVYTGKPISGVLVVKADLDEIDTHLANYGTTTGILSKEGIIFACNRKNWLFHAALPLSPMKKLRLKQSKQFARAPLSRLPFHLHRPEFHYQGDKYRTYRLPLKLKGWTLFSLHSREHIFPFYIYPVTILIIIVLGGAAIALLLLYSKKKKITNQREYARSKLREQRAQYGHIFNSTSDGLLIIDFQGRITDLNPQAALFLSGEKNALIGKKVEQLLSPENPALFRSFFSKISLEGYTTSSFSPEQQDGKPILLHCTGTPFEGNGNIMTLITIHDITEIKTNEKRLKYHRDHLSLINRILRHDISNGLMVVLSSLDNYIMNHRQKDLNNAREGAVHCVNTIKEMKEFEEFIASHSDLYSINLRDLLEPLIEKYSETAIRIEGDASAMGNIGLSSIFNNIISNAINHSGSNSIDISIITEQQFCKIIFADTGIGIPDEVKDKIFEENFHYGATGKTGLGLYIVKKAISNMGGSVSITNNKPSGSIFTIVLRLNLQ